LEELNSLRDRLSWYDHEYRGVDITFIDIKDNDDYKAVEISVEAGLYTVKYLFTYGIIYVYARNPKSFIEQHYPEVLEMAHYYINKHWEEYYIHGQGD